MIKAKFRLVETKRTALFKQSSSRDFNQTGWGTTVKLSQIREDGMTASLELVLNEVEAKQFNDAEIGSEFEITVSPV